MANKASKKQLHQAAPGTGAQVLSDADVMTMEEAIAMLKTTRPTFYRWVRAGKLKGMKVGRQWRFLREDINRFLKGQQPRIDLPADIDPLLASLAAKLSELGIPGGGPEEQDKTARAMRLMIRLALAMDASDIHIDPQADGAQFRLRVAGALHLICRFDLRLLPPIAQRWQMAAGMDVREKSLPQDGRMLADVDGKRIDLRVSCMPAYLGEAIVARLLLPGTVCLDLDRLEYAAGDRRRLDQWLGAPWGMLLFTGPTGSGKTTTIYSCLMKVAKTCKKILSVEDPVEYVLPGVTQVQVNPKTGLTFERAMRSFLRSDPDAIVVGEVRNAEMMQSCLIAALTGHLVLTTLHVDEAAGALGRMIDLGCEPFVVADATKLILAQRLVRKLCPDCSVEAMPTPEQLARAQKLSTSGGLGWDALPRRYRKAVGCEKCGKLGYRGRTVIAETLEITPEISAALRRKAPTDEIRAIAVSQGMTTMAADGIRRGADGLVSLPEVLSVVGNISY